MAVTVTFDLPEAKCPQGLSPSLAIITGSIAFDNSYADGGESLAAITAKFKTCLRILFDNQLGYLFQWDKASGKVIVYQTVDGTAGTRNAVASEADISALTAVNFIATGLL